MDYDFKTIECAGGLKLHECVSGKEWFVEPDGSLTEAGTGRVKEPDGTL